MKYDFAINDAIIISSEKRYKPYVASLAIKDEEIAEISNENFSHQDAENVIYAENKVLMPGLVNAHCHGDMTVARGLGDGKTLQEQNRDFESSAWFSKVLSAEDRYYSRQLTYLEALCSGTTIILENMFWGLEDKSIKAMTEMGIHGALAEDIRPDFSKPHDLMSEFDIKQFVEKCSDNSIVPMLGIISEEDFDLDLLRKIQKIINKAKIRYTSHLAETKWRMDIVRGKFDTTPVDVLSKADLLSKNYLGSHAVQINSEDMEILSANKSSLVCTPLCEMKIQDGVAPIWKMREKGINVCLGTDGALWNNSNDIFREMKATALLQALYKGPGSVDIASILDMATINGARALGIEKDYGSIELGKKADLILIDFDQAHLRPIQYETFENVTSSVVYNVTGKDVSDVFVNGKQVVKNSKYIYRDVTEIINHNEDAAKRIRKFLNENKGA